MFLNSISSLVISAIDWTLNVYNEFQPYIFKWRSISYNIVEGLNMYIIKYRWSHYCDYLMLKHESPSI